MLTMRFLRAVSAASPNGVGSSEMQMALGAEHPKGIGSKMSYVNGRLRTLGFPLEEIYTTSRSPVGRVWTAGPRIDVVIDGLQEIIDAHAE
jgi:hypothetical protein